MRPILAALVVVLLAGCGGPSHSTSAGSSTGPAPETSGGTPATTGPARSTTAPSTTGRAASITPTTLVATSTTPPPTWILGAQPLPRRPDGYGEMRPTPTALVDRRLTAPDLLPPPADGRFHSAVERISPAVRARMGATYHEGCPVTLNRLRHVTLSFQGFDGRPHTGELVVAEQVAERVTSVFRTLFQAGFQIEEMRLPTTPDLDAEPTGDGNNTAAFVCRNARGTNRWSSHARGIAIDVNPFQNPYTKGDVILPELAGAYVDRSKVRPGMILPFDVVTRAFASIGWTWGGTWRRPVDRQHFSADGR